MSMSLHFLGAMNHLVLGQAAGAPAGTFDVVNMVKSIQGFGIVVALILVLMSIYSLGVMAERLVTYARTRPPASTRRTCATCSPPASSATPWSCRRS
jgi:hypothetical protein